MPHQRTTPGVKTRFTREDKKFLTDNFYKLTNQQLADALRMSLTVVRNQCARMHLRRTKVYGWTAAQTAFLVRHYTQMGDVEIAELMNLHFPRKTRPWTRKHIGKKRMLMDLLRTPEQLTAIRDRNNAQNRYNLEEARKAFQEKVNELTDDYILSNVLRISKPNRPKVLKEHSLLIALTRQSIRKRREARQASPKSINYATN